MRDLYSDLLLSGSGPSAYDLGAPLLAPSSTGAAAARLLGGGPSDTNGNGAAPLDKVDPGLEPKEQKKARWEAKLSSRLKEVQSASEKPDSEKAVKALKDDYAKARSESAELDPELEKAVKEALGESDSGGDSNSNSFADLMGGLADAFGGGDSNGAAGGGGCDGGGCSGGGCNGGGGGGGGGGINFAPPNVNPQDREFLNQGVTTDPEHFKNQFGGWYQGAEGNCATVATIKAAMDRYDDKVFDEVNRTDNGVSVKLQNGDMVNLSNGELATARQLSSFRGQDQESVNYANLCYAVAAKRAQQFGNDGARDFAGACRSLNNGQDIYSPAKFLGLEKQMVRLNPRTLDGQDSVVGGSWKHAVFVNKGKDGRHVTDRYGRGVAYNGTDTWGNGLTDAYTFKPREIPKIPSTRTTVMGGSKSTGTTSRPSTSTATTTRSSAPTRTTTSTTATTSTAKK